MAQQQSPLESRLESTLGIPVSRWRRRRSAGSKCLERSWQQDSCAQLDNSAQGDARRLLGCMTATCVWCSVRPLGRVELKHTATYYVSAQLAPILCGRDVASGFFYKFHR